MMEYRIERARKEDAEFISDAIMMAIGREIEGPIADDRSGLKSTRELFKMLAEREDSQYSYQNSFVARTPDGKTVGALIIYDGARLKKLRKVFIEKANSMLNWGIDETKIKDETSPDEIYIDSIMVLPEARGNGIAKALLKTGMEAFKEDNKPFGLLVEEENSPAEKLYRKMGFKKVGTRPFLGQEMNHMQKFINN